MSFDFIDTLFDQRQYEKFAISIFEKFYFRLEDESSSFAIWFDASTGGSVKTSSLELSYFDFCKDKPECYSALENEILEKLFQDGKNAKNRILEEAQNDIIKAKSVGDQYLNILNLAIENFTSADWLTDKQYILKELNKNKENITLTFSIIETSKSNIQSPVIKSLNSKLTDNQLERIYRLVKEINLFKDPFEIDDLKSIFLCTATKTYPINNNHEFVCLFNYLQPEFISKNWQSIVAHNKFVCGPKGATINSKNLSSSLSQADLKSPSAVKIKHLVETLNDPIST